MKKNSGKAPSYQMYPKDWNEDAALKMCSYAAQGLWIRLINTSYDMPVKGVFGFNNEPLSEQEILTMLSGNMRSKKNAFAELKKWQVIKRMDDKSFYCKRLYKDMRLREIRKESGSKGGNPNLVKDLDNQNANQSAKQKATPSSSNSNSSSISLSLELNKLAIVYDDKLHKLFGDLTKTERVTFRNIRFYLISLREIYIFKTAIDWIGEVKQWSEDHDKSNIEAKKCYVSKIKKMGWNPKSKN